MAENLFTQLLNHETDPEEFLEWLTRLDYQDPKFAALSTKYRCSRTDFVTFFLNFVHEELGSLIGEKKSEADDTKSSGDMNRSHSFPLDLSDNVANSTPKITKVNSDSIVSYMSPVSPIYKTPRAPKSSLCLGDFITGKKVSSRKKHRRITPTNLSQNKFDSFHKCENSFNFNKSETDEFPVERNVLAEERLRILSRSNLQNVTGSPMKITRSFSGEVQAEVGSVKHRDEVDRIVTIYTELLKGSFVLSLTSEIYFLVSLLMKKQYYNGDWGVEVLSDRIIPLNLFSTIHNVVYFACRSLACQARILENYDNSTIRLLVENQRLEEFAPDLVERLRKVNKPDRITEIQAPQNNICFNLDTDNRQNFPNDLSFHAFRKQRDLFYEILRIWELHHLAPGFNFAMSLAGKVRTLLSLSSEPTNFVHFARLFKAQLLNACRSGEDFITSLEVDAQKLNKLKSRCTTKGTCQGLNSLPVFGESEEFYKDFILVASNHCFNRHLADSLVEEIRELNDSNFGGNELGETDENVDFVTKKSYYTCIKNLRTLAKFLGFVESLPYKSENSYSEQLMATHLKIRKQVCTHFDVKPLLENSIRRKCVILCVPWLIKYLSMLDHVTLRLPYYVQIQTDLYWIYRNFDWGPDPNLYLVKFCLGWLFELPHIPDNDFLHFCTRSSAFALATPKFCLDKLEIVDQDILYFCCPYLDEIKKLLSTPSTTQCIAIKHITPVTALQSPEEVARKKLEQQLEEAFFSGQPTSLRKTVEFVSERVASTCVKYVCHTLVPHHKKLALEKFKSSIDLEEDDALKTALKTKANQMAATCLAELQESCERETKTISNEKIQQGIEALLGLDVLPQTKHICVGITRKSCRERVKQWIDSHVTLSVFIKDFHDEIQRYAKRARKPVFILPSGGNKANHDGDTISAAHLLEKYRTLAVQVVEKKPIETTTLLTLLDDTSRSINQRGDFNQCILSTICTQLLDLVILLLAHDWQILTDSVIVSRSLDIWKLYYNGCDDLFKSLLCPRNVNIFSRSVDMKATWDAFAKICASLLKDGLLSRDVFESQCTGIFRTDWDQTTLTLITDFFKTVGELCREQGGRTFLLDFLSDYCEDLC